MCSYKKTGMLSTTRTNTHAHETLGMQVHMVATRINMCLGIPSARARHCFSFKYDVYTRKQNVCRSHASELLFVCLARVHRI